MFKTISAILHDTGLDYDAVTADAVKTTLGIAVNDTDTMNITIASQRQEFALDAMAIARPEIIATVTYGTTGLPTIDETTTASLKKLASGAVRQTQEMYANKNYCLRPISEETAAKQVFRFCLQFARQTRKYLCFNDPWIGDISRRIRRLNIKNIQTKDLILADCLPENVSAFTDEDIETAVKKYKEKQNESK